MRKEIECIVFGLVVCFLLVGFVIGFIIGEKMTHEYYQSHRRGIRFI